MTEDLMLDLNTSFDTTTAMLALFLWLVFGLLSPHFVNCDVQRLIANNVYARQATGLLAFFFLFTLIDSGSADASLSTTVVKTVLVYALFISFTKSKWYFAIPVMVLLAASQLVRKALEKRAVKLDAQDQRDEAARARRVARITDVSINCAVVALVVVGMLHYAWLQRIEYGSDFSLRTFFFETNHRCKREDPDYGAMLASKSKSK